MTVKICNLCLLAILVKTVLGYIYIDSKEAST